jgi:ligand-binding SRPBCC domain-containing protein
MRHTHHAEQWLPYPVPLIFAFFANPANLPRLMPAWQNARIEEASIVPPPRPLDQSIPRTIAAGPGTRLTLSFRPFPYSTIRIPWEAEITEFVWNDHFCDRQLRGPFAYWNHCHRVRPETRDQTNGTLITDQVEYELPFGIAGELTHRLILSRQIAHTFTQRQTRLTKLLSSSALTTNH